MQKIYTKSNRTYGYRRVTEKLRSSGRIINAKTVRKLMIALGIKGGDKRV
ncbi:IS3 family transposase [Basilea psittacipulmonis]